ncbi:hypothetical protein Spb1_27530 [Planctopirus ephydatiae]|uniref:Uncharacterized protein n=1 Tax=Planctopirus ephydatiae TaxID=2528019 RepID=A0A518GQB7_9PLAN|nr:hypothetical protein Spb1_27530 [Planctopirus ephydatiae]
MVVESSLIQPTLTRIKLTKLADGEFALHISHQSVTGCPQTMNPRVSPGGADVHFDWLRLDARMA